MTLSHVDEAGRARMVDVSAKPVTGRMAIAEGRVKMCPEAFDLVRANGIAKGNVLGTAQLAGIMGAKRTADLIPLCHSLPLDQVQVDIELVEEWPGVRITATAAATARTGVEMEALTAVAVAALTVYDMVKAVDRTMEIGAIRLLEKTGGARGDWRADSKKEESPR